jgi:plastocyanin
MQASARRNRGEADSGTKARLLAAFVPYWVALPLLACHGAQALAEPRVHQVVIEAMQISPQEIEAAPGDTVVWTNKDPFPHTVTSSGAKGKGFDSGEIAPDHSWKLVVRDKGRFSYVCTLHPTMKASLVVK